MPDQRLADLQTNWIGRHVTVSHPDYPDGPETGTIVAITHSGRKLGRLGWPYIITFDHGTAIYWNPTTRIEETARG